VIIIELLPPPYRRLSYKIKELILSVRLTKAWGKKKILYVFLNKVYLGNGCFGVDAAARFYFGKTVQQLTIAEASQIAALVARPSKYNPFKNADRAQQRKILVLERMRRVEFITEEQYEEALNQKLVFRKQEQKNP
jgi:penicillin-binding protein 1A